MPDYTIVLQDNSGVYSLFRIWRGGTTNNSGGTEITPANTTADRNPFVSGLQALVRIKNDKAEGN